MLSDESNHYVNCSISQYGIGAKAAAFYVGQSLSVSSYTGEPQARVYELTLSQEMMKSRYEATGNAYRSQLTARPVGAPAQCAWLHEGREVQRHSDAVERVIRDGITQERDGTPFTRLLISGVRLDLFEDVRDKVAVVETLADVYDRHLHGPYGQGEGNAQLNASAIYHSPIIALRYTNQGHERWKVDDLRTIRTNQQSNYSRHHKVGTHPPARPAQLIAAPSVNAHLTLRSARCAGVVCGCVQGTIWRCAIEVPAPETEKAPEGSDRRARARVEVLYFPRELDGETHPDLRRASELEEGIADEADGPARHRRRASATSPREQLPDEGELAGAAQTIAAQVAQLRSQRSMCSMFWHGRLIPLTTCGPLYFMTAQSTEYRDCLNRMKGTLTFHCRGRRSPPLSTRPVLIALINPCACVLPPLSSCDSLPWAHSPFLQLRTQPLVLLLCPLMRLLCCCPLLSCGRQVNIFFAAPILTNRVKLLMRGEVGDLLNRETDVHSGWEKSELIVDEKGQSYALRRNKFLKDLFAKQIKEWALLDANYQFMAEHYLQELSLKEEFALFRQVELGNGDVVKAGQLVKVQLRSSSPPHVFVRVLCVRREQRTGDYEKDKRPVWSRGSIIGYIEPKELEALPPGFSHSMKDDASLPRLFALQPAQQRLSDLDARLAMKKLKLYSLRSVLKAVSEETLKKEYQEHLQRARAAYPRRISVYATPREELRHGMVKQCRVKDSFAPTAVIAWAADRPVAGEKVRQSFYTLPAVRPPQSLQQSSAAMEEERKGQPRSTSQLGKRGRQIPRVGNGLGEVRQRDEDGSAVLEERYSNSGRRVVSRLSNLSRTHIIGHESQPQQRQQEKGKGKRGAAAADEAEEKSGKRRKKMSGRASNELEAKEAGAPPPEEEKREMWGSPFEADVCSVEHANSIADTSIHFSVIARTIAGFKEKRFDRVGRYQVEYALLSKIVPGDRDHVAKVAITMEVFPGLPTVFLTTHAEAELNIKLGQPATAGLYLHVQDQWANAITPKSMQGWQEPAMSCPFTIICDEFPTLKISANPTLQSDQQSDTFFLGGVTVEPTEEDLQTLTFSDPRGGRKLQCRLIFHIAVPLSSSSSSPPSSAVVAFVICLRPGDAQVLDARLFPAECPLTNTDAIPDFALQLRDGFGQPTGIDADPVHQPNAFPLVSIWIDDPFFPDWHKGRIPPQRLNINGHLHSAVFKLPPVYMKPEDMTTAIVDCDEPRQLKEHYPFVVHLRCEDELSAAVYEEQCRVALLPRQQPSYALVYDPTVQEEVNYSSGWLLPPNAEVPLAVKMVEDSGAGWDIDDGEIDGYAQQGWRSWLTPSLRKAIRVFVSNLEDSTGYPYECPLNDLQGNRLPRLKLPRRVAVKQLKCELRIEFDESRVHRKEAARPGMSAEELKEISKEEDQVRYLRSRLPFTREFEVRVQFGGAVRWSAEMQSPAIKCAAQWGNKIKFFAVDRWGNKVATPDAVGRPRARVQAVPPAEEAANAGKRGPQDGEAEDERKGGGQLSSSEAEDREDAFLTAELKLADPSRIECWRSEGDRHRHQAMEDEEVQLAEWDHFLYPKAFLLMRTGHALLTVYDDAGKLEPSDDLPFLVEVGQAKKVRAYLRDPVTWQRTRLRNDLLLPARLMFDQLFVTWFDRAWNPAEPNIRAPNQLVAKMDRAALFVHEEREAKVGKEVIVAKEQTPSVEGGSVFPPFLCIYSPPKRAEEQKEEKIRDVGDDSVAILDPATADDLAHAVMTLKVGLWNGKEPQTELCSIPLRCCMLPYSVISLTVTSLFPQRSMEEIQRHRHLLSDAIIAELQRLQDSVEIAGTPAPIIEVELKVQPNESSLTYSLPAPDPSSLSLEWKLNNHRVTLPYHPATLDAASGVYHFRPRGQGEGEDEGERKEDDAVHAVMNKAGQWTYRVVYREKRPTLLQVLQYPTKELTVSELILPGYPAGLRVGAHNSASSLPVVGSTGSRSIVKNLRLVVVDQFGGVVYFTQLSHSLTDALRSVQWEVQPVDDPSAVADAARPRQPPIVAVHGLQVNAEQHCLVIAELGVEEREGTLADLGQYVVIFRLPPPFEDFYASLKFFFSPVERLLEEKRKEEERRQAERQSLQQKAAEAAGRVSVIKTTISSLQQSFTQWRTSADRLAEQEQELLAGLEGVEQAAALQLYSAALREEIRVYAETSLSSAAVVVHPFAKVEPVIVDALRALHERCVRVEPVIQPSAPGLDLSLDSSGRRMTLAEHGYYGQLASFLFVEDERLCRLLSWFFQPHLSMFIVTHRSCLACRLLSANAQGMHIRIMYEEGQSPPNLRRPLPHLRLPPAVQATITANPRFAMDLLSVQAEPPQVRGLIQHMLSLVVGDTITMTSMEDATRYRRLLSQHRIGCPTILALAEMKALSALNVERWGAKSTAPSLASLPIRVGVETKQVKEWMQQVDDLRTSARRVRVEAEELQRQWREGMWLSHIDRLTQEMREEETQKRTSDELLRGLGGGGASASVSSLAALPTERSHHRRRMPTQ